MGQNWPRRLCVSHPMRRCNAQMAIVFVIVRSSLFFLRLLLLTHFGESPVCEHLFPPIFWHKTRRYMQKKIFFNVILIFLRKKKIFERFFDFLRPAFSHGRLGHPQSLEYFWYNFVYLQYFYLVSILKNINKFIPLLFCFIQETI